MIACCDMQFEDVTLQNFLWEDLEYVMTDNGVTIVSFKGIMVDNTQAN